MLSSAAREGIIRCFTVIRERKPFVCPGCGNSMTALSYLHGKLHIDLCGACGGVWFDKNEETALVKILRKRTNIKELHVSPVTNNSVSSLSELMLRYDSFKDTPYSSSFKDAAFQLLTNLPLERNLKPVCTPVATRAIVFVNIIIFFISQQTGLEEFAMSYGYIHASGNYLKIFSAMCTHGSILHLAGNMYFLWILGDNVEDIIGPVKFIFFYLIAGIFATLVSGMTLDPEIVRIGASGAVAGVMGAYFILFPRARFIIRLFIFIVFPVSSLLYLFFWGGYQFLIAYAGSTNIDWAAHLGGLAVGAGYGLYLRLRRRSAAGAVMTKSMV